MRNANPRLIQLLQANTFMFADLFTIVLLDGSNLRFTNANTPLKVNGLTYLSKGPIISRDSTSISVGVSVDTLDIQIINDTDYLVGGRSLMQAFRLGIFDGATFTLERVFMSPDEPTNTDAGTITLFKGYLVEPEIDNLMITASAVSISDRLAIKMPRNLYQPSCQNTLFDSVCALDRSEFSSESYADQNSSKNLIVCTLDKPQNWFTQGVIEFTSGLNTGIKRTVRLHNSTGLLVTLPFDNDVKMGDTFRVYPGCDKRLNTCELRFNNLTNFKGTPFVPVPETSV